MIVIGTASHAEKRRRKIDVDGIEFYKGEWLETDQDPMLSPTMFLVEQPPNTVLDTHYHGENQFQLFVKGGGSLGRDAIGPVTVHYAGAFTGYGPLKSGEDGIFYFTIRSVFETGRMIGAAQMVRGPKRHFATKPLPPMQADELKSLTATESIDLIEMQPDGIAARALRIPAGAATPGLDPATGGGQFYIVVGGEMLHGDQKLGRWESVFYSSDEATPELRAGPDGLEVICLQLAPKEQVYIDAKEKAAAAVPA